MKMIPPSRRANLGLTIVEMIVAVAITATVMSLVAGVSVSVVNTCSASIDFAENQNQQLLVRDYLSRDLRNATKVAVTADLVSITIPDYYTDEHTPEEPTIIKGSKITYGPTPFTVTYSITDSSLVRTSNAPNDQPRLVLVDSLDRISLQFQELGRVVESTMTFDPKFRPFGETNKTVREGTKAVSRTILRNLN